MTDNSANETAPASPSSTSVDVNAGQIRGPLTISISPRTIAIVFSVFFIIWVFRTLPETLLILSLAGLLATVADRPSRRLEAQGIPRGLALLIIIGGVVGILTYVVSLLVPVIQDEYSTMQSHLGDLQTEAVNTLAERGIHLRGLSTERIASSISANMASITDNLANIGFGIGHVAISIFAAVVMGFMLASSPHAGTRLAARFLNAAQHQRLMRMAHDVQDRLFGWARGQLLVAVSFGILFGLGLWIIGIPYATTLGIVAAVLEFVPYLGGFVTLMLAGVIALTIGVPEVIAVIVLYTVLINIESHILAPKLVGDAVGLPSVIVLLALLVGLEMKGIVGVFLAVPTALIISAILDEFWPAPPEEGPELETPPTFMQRIRARFGHVLP